MMPTADDMLHGGFATLPDLIAAHAREQGDKIALIHDDRRLDYRGLDAAMDRFASRLQADGIVQGSAIAIVGAPLSAIIAAI